MKDSKCPLYPFMTEYNNVPVPQNVSKTCSKAAGIFRIELLREKGRYYNIINDMTTDERLYYEREN